MILIMNNCRWNSQSSIIKNIAVIKLLNGYIEMTQGLKYISMEEKEVKKMSYEQLENIAH